MILWSGNPHGTRPMNKHLILSFIADDRPGLVDRLSEAVTQAGGNWLESRLAHMAEKFAGIVRVELPDDGKAQALKSSLQALEAEGIRVSIAEAQKEAERSGTAVVIDLVGLDHPGIVREITHCLAGRRVSIETMDTYTDEAPMGGGILFHARMEVRYPAGLDEEQLRRELEGIAQALMVDLTMQEKAGEGGRA
jgi:glycine cleavage system regulatory protein